VILYKKIAKLHNKCLVSGQIYGKHSHTARAEIKSVFSEYFKYTDAAPGKWNYYCGFQYC